MKRNLWLLTIVLFSLIYSASAQPARKQTTIDHPNPNWEKVKKITTVEGVSEYRLKNGLRVLLFPDQSKEVITVNITYLVGSRHEGYGETGMAHLLEHLMFKGSANHKNIPQELSSHGARPNGTTWYDRTNYFETFAATDENFNWALDLEADRMTNSFIAKKDLDSEFSVVRNEYERGENDPSNILSERIFSTAYLWHNYGKSTIGAKSDIEQVPIDRLQAFYRNYYQPDNAVLIVSGKFDPNKALILIDEKFGRIPCPTRKLQNTYTIEPTQDGEREVTLRRVGDIQVVGCAYHIPAGTHPDFQAINILMRVLTEEPNGILYKKLIETKLATGLGGYNFELKEPSAAYFSAEVLKEKNLVQVKDTLINTLENLNNTIITKENVERIKNKITKEFDLELNSVEKVALSLSEYIAQGDWKLLFYNRDLAQKVTVDDVVRVAQTYFKSSNRTLGYFYPTVSPKRVDIPNAPDIAEVLKDYKGSDGIAQGEAFDPSPQNIHNRTTQCKIGTINTLLLFKKTRGKEVNVSINFRFGTLQSLQNQNTVAGFASALLNKGTKKHTQQQIQDELTRLKADVGFSDGTGSINVSIKTVRENLTEVIALVAEMLKEPAFENNELDKLKNETIAGLEQQKSDPQSLALKKIKQHMYAYPIGHPYHVYSVEEELEKVKSTTIDDIKKFHNKFYGAQNGYITIVGDFDSLATKKSIKDTFETWAKNDDFKRIPYQIFSPKPINDKIETPDKANGFLVSFQDFALNQNNIDYPALVMANYMFGGGFLNSRLATRIRQKEGISYGVGSQINTMALDDVSFFITYAIFAPENLTKLEIAFAEELQKVLKEGFSQPELDDAKKGYLQSRKVSRSQDGGLASTLNTYAFIKRDILWDEEFENKITQLSLEQVNSSFKKHISYNKLSLVKAGNFAKKKP